MKINNYFLKKSFYLIVLFILVQACEPNNSKDFRAYNQIEFDTTKLDCLSNFEIFENETINKMYGKQKMKEGHWINFEMNLSPNKKIIKVKTEEGHYHLNKKVGVWKYFDSKGITKDSINYN
jgi:hypothetical protein